MRRAYWRGLAQSWGEYMDCVSVSEMANVGTGLKGVRVSEREEGEG